MMKLQGAECVLAGLLGALFVVNVQGFFHQPERQLCKASGEPCFSYDVNSRIGPRCWFKIDFPNEKCCNENGKLQSPIDIPEVENIITVPGKLRYSSRRFSGKMANSGIQPAFKRDEEEDLVFLEGIGSPKDERYFIDNIHFHVGVKGEERQTENLLNGKSFDGEAHIVHIREDYGDLETAAAHPQGLLVISIFLSTSGEGEKRSDAFDELIELIRQVQEFDVEEGACANLRVDEHEYFKRSAGYYHRQPFCGFDTDDADASDSSRSNRCNFYTHKNCKSEEDTINPNDLLADSPVYYYFQGGLTTPPCSESVVWMVARKPREVTSFYPFVVRKMETQIEGEELGKFGNLRPLQDLEGRKVFLYRFGYRCWWKYAHKKNNQSEDVADSPFAHLH